MLDFYFVTNDDYMVHLDIRYYHYDPNVDDDDVVCAVVDDISVPITTEIDGDTNAPVVDDINKPVDGDNNVPNTKPIANNNSTKQAIMIDANCFVTE